jgi:hypothetical protein
MCGEDSEDAGQCTAADFPSVLMDGSIEWWNSHMGRHPFSSFGFEFSRGHRQDGFDRGRRQDDSMAARQWDFVNDIADPNLGFAVVQLFSPGAQLPTGDRSLACSSWSRYGNCPGTMIPGTPLKDEDVYEGIEADEQELARCNQCDSLVGELPTTWRCNRCAVGEFRITQYCPTCFDEGRRFRSSTRAVGFKQLISEAGATVQRHFALGQSAKL